VTTFLLKIVYCSHLTPDIYVGIYMLFRIIGIELYIFFCNYVYKVRKKKNCMASIKCSKCRRDVATKELYYCPSDFSVNLCLECFRKHKCRDELCGEFISSKSVGGRK
jgi:hypothetical protein